MYVWLARGGAPGANAYSAKPIVGVLEKAGREWRLVGLRLHALGTADALWAAFNLRDSSPSKSNPRNSFPRAKSPGCPEKKSAPTWLPFQPLSAVWGFVLKRESGQNKHDGLLALSEPAHLRSLILPNHFYLLSSQLFSHYLCASLPPNHVFVDSPLPRYRSTTPTAKMSVVSLLGVNVMNNPAKFTDKYEFEITFECLEPLQKGALCSPSC